MKAGHRLPDFIADAPSLRIGLQLYFQAFIELNGCRISGMGEGPIPWTAVHQYAQWMELDEEQTEDLHYLIGHMDQVYLKHREAKREHS